MTEQPVSISINISLTELPKCQTKADLTNNHKEKWEDCSGCLLPIMDVLQSDIPYLKGWFCPSCKTVYVFRGGDMVTEAIEEVKIR